MKSLFLRAAAVAACLAVMGTASVSCGKKDGSSTTNLAGDGPADDVEMDEEDMPYGATMTVLKPDYDENVRVSIEFDNRYFKEYDGKYDEIYRLSNYFYALSNADADVMNEAMYPDYFKYSYEQADMADGTEYLEGYYSNLTEKIGEEDFDINYLIVEDCFTDEDEAAASDFAKMDDIVEKIDGGETLSKVTARKGVYVTAYYASESGSYSLNEKLGQAITMYIYEIDGVPYII